MKKAVIVLNAKRGREQEACDWVFCCHIYINMRGNKEFSWLLVLVVRIKRVYLGTIRSRISS